MRNFAVSALRSAFQLRRSPTAPIYIYPGHALSEHSRKRATAYSNTRSKFSSVSRPLQAPAAATTEAHQGNSEARLPFVTTDANKTAVGWDSRAWSKFHHFWLRDHCRCPKCFHGITKQRLFNTFDIPSDIKPTAVQALAEGLQVTWPENGAHTSLYPWTWLREHSYDPPSSIVHSNHKNEKVLWGSQIKNDPPSVTYNDVIADDCRGLYQWLSKIDRFGFCFVNGVPPTAEATEELVQRIGFIRETQYGKFWDFTSDLSKGDTAYTTLALGAHTDTTYFTDPCGLQIFHLLSHTEGSGGASLLVDGFYVASLLRSVHPRAFDILSRVKVRGHAAGEAGCLYTPAGEGYPVISVENGEPLQIRWNNDDRSVVKGLSANEVEEWYDAIRVWNEYITSGDAEYWVQLTPGTVVAIDNHRVLHGRSAFDGKRRMCGAYIGGDEFRSKLAVLKEQLSNSTGSRSVWAPQL